jgi:hypothetical protein
MVSSTGVAQLFGRVDRSLKQVNIDRAFKPNRTAVGQFDLQFGSRAAADD